MLLNFIFIICISLCCKYSSSNESELDEKCDDGVCKLASQCPTASQNIENGVPLKICGVENSNLELNVCCQSPDEPIPLVRFHQNDGERSNAVHFYGGKPPIYKKKCFEYATKTCNGILKLSSFNEENDQKKFPHSALIGYRDRLPIYWKCGGSLISEFHILTVAYCEYMTVGELGYARWARLGIEIDSSPIYEIIHRFVHPNYHYPSLQDDIAIFKLKEKIQFTAYVHPICLFKEEVLEQKELFSVGFERKNCQLYSNCREEDAEKQDHVRQSGVIIKTPSQLHDSSYCAEIFENDEKLGDGLHPESTLCVHLKESFSSECQGTSGDALLHKIETGCPNFYNLVGVSSVIGHWPNVYGCNFLNTSIIYTKISQYLPWIEDIVWKEIPKIRVSPS